MNDPVLNRKMFRQVALKKGKLQPKKYNIGSPAYGVSPYGPFLTNESQGIGPNYLENQPGNRVVVKDGRRMIVDRFGNVIKTEYMPAPYKKPNIFKRMGSGIFNVAERIFDPVKGYPKNVEDLRRAKEYIKSGDVVRDAGKVAGKVGSGIKSIVKQTPGVVAVEKGLSTTGINPVDKAFGMPNEGFATLLTSEGFKAASDRMVKSPSAIKRGLGYMMRVPGAAGFARAGATKLLMNPVGLTAMGIGALGYGGKKLEDYLRATNPEYKKQAEFMQSEAGQEIFSPMTPDDMMNVMTNQQKNDMRKIVPNTGTEGAMSKSDLETKGEINNLVAEKPDNVKPGGDVQTPPTGTQKPGGAPEGGDLESNISNAAGTKTDLNNTLKVNNKETGIDKKIPGLSISDKLLKFSQTTAGNMFMLKFAAGLLSGKGSFGEVVGNALNPAVDLLAAYRLKEDENAYKQMKLLLDAKGKEENQNGMIRIMDEDGSVRAVPAIRDKKTLKTYRIMPNGDQVAVSSNQASMFRPYQDAKVTDVNEALTAYSNVATARALTDFVASQDTALLGTSGFAKRTFDRIIGAGKGYLEAMSKADLQPTFTDENGTVLSGDAKKEAEKKWSEITAGSKRVFDQTDPTERKRLEQLGLTETTLRYFLANAFKQKDRLTNVDLQLINDLVQTMGASLSGEQVKDKMVALQGILDEKMNTYRENIRDFGIDDYQFATRFYQKPGAKIAFGLVAEETAPEFKTFKDDPKALEDYLKKKGFK